MAKQFEEQEFQASVSDQAGLLRSRVPTPMLHALKAKHGDLIHYTMTGPDSVEVKVVRSRGFSGDRPYMTRETGGNGAAKKSSTKGTAKAGASKSSEKSKGTAGKTGQKSGKTKKKVRFNIPGF